MFNRGDFTKGYMYEADMGKIMYQHSQGHKGVEVGEIQIVKDKFCIASTKQNFNSGDAFKIFRNNIELPDRSFAGIPEGDTLDLSKNRFCEILPGFQPLPYDRMGLLKEGETV